MIQNYTVRTKVLEGFEGLCDFDFFAKLYETVHKKGDLGLTFYEFREIIQAKINTNVQNAQDDIYRRMG